jgi:hypothetical protein
MPLFFFMLLLTIHVAFAQFDPCRYEIQRTETVYEMCIKFDKHSSGYVDCIKLYMEQKTKTNEICRFSAIPPAPWELYPIPTATPECVATEPVPAPAPVPAPVEVPAEVPVATPEEEEEPQEKVSEKKGVRFGFRAGFHINDFSFGYKELDEEIGLGYGFGGGLALNIPFSNYVRLNLGLDLYYKLLFNGTFGDTDEATVSVPILLQFGKAIYIASGVQLDFPTGLTESGLGNTEFMDNRYSMDFDVVFGLGYMSQNFGIDFRYVWGITSIFKDFTYNKIDYKGKKNWLGQYGFGVCYYFG